MTGSGIARRGSLAARWNRLLTGIVKLRRELNARFGSFIDFVEGGNSILSRRSSVPSLALLGGRQSRLAIRTNQGHVRPLPERSCIRVQG